MRLLIFNLRHKKKKKKKRKKEHTFTKRIDDKGNSYINERNSTPLDTEIEQKK